MGELVKKPNRIEEKIKERKIQKPKANKRELNIVEEIAEKNEKDALAMYQRPKNPPREKLISARVNGDIFNRFKVVCEKNNMTTNAGLNMLIAEYVKTNE